MRARPTTSMTSCCVRRAPQVLNDMGRAWEAVQAAGQAVAAAPAWAEAHATLARAQINYGEVRTCGSTAAV